MHYWGDDWPYWDDLNQCVNYISKRARDYRIGGQIKEKYGTVRWYIYLHDMISDLIWPGHIWVRWNAKSWWHPALRWAQPVLGPVMSWIDYRIYSTKKNPVKTLIQKYQYKKVLQIYKEALEKWPHLRKEILSSSDLDSAAKRALANSIKEKK